MKLLIIIESDRWSMVVSLFTTKTQRTQRYTKREAKLKIAIFVPFVTWW